MAMYGLFLPPGPALFYRDVVAIFTGDDDMPGVRRIALMRATHSDLATHLLPDLPYSHWYDVPRLSDRRLFQCGDPCCWWLLPDTRTAMFPRLLHLFGPCCASNCLWHIALSTLYRWRDETALSSIPRLFLPANSWCWCDDVLPFQRRHVPFGGERRRFDLG